MDFLDVLRTGRRSALTTWSVHDHVWIRDTGSGTAHYLTYIALDGGSVAFNEVTESI